MKRAGAVFAGHYHARLLKTPTELVNAIGYVLGNAAHHFGERGADAFSSAGLPAEGREGLLARGVGWLVRMGWRRAAFVGEPAATTLSVLIASPCAREPNRCGCKSVRLGKVLPESSRLAR